MTPKIFFTAVLLIVFNLFTQPSIAGKKISRKSSEIKLVDKHDAGNTGKPVSSSHGHATPLLPSTKSPLPVDKGHAQTPTMDETPHIHHFHKERVKKIKKHHSKFWFISKLILILCHISLLVIAFLHATH